jgi:hypothetical protein
LGEFNLFSQWVTETNTSHEVRLESILQKKKKSYTRFETVAANESTKLVTYLLHSGGRAIAQAVSRWLPTAAARVRARVWQVEFVVDKMAPRQVFSEYFGFPCQPHFIPPTSPSS